MEIKEVSIRQNPKVLVTDFLEAVQDGFDRHGVASKVILPDEATECPYVVTYTARRSWDIMPYLSYAEVTISRDGKQVAQAVYHLRARGGLSPLKWATTKEKMDPVMDDLLKYQNHPWLKRGL